VLLKKYVFDKHLQLVFGFLGIQGAMNFMAFFVGQKRRAGTHTSKAHTYAINKKDNALSLSMPVCVQRSSHAVVKWQSKTFLSTASHKA
jgi:hypothetical protein